MKVCSTSTFILGILLALGCAEQKDLDSKIADVLGDTQGTFAIAYKNLSTGETYYLNPDVIFHAASTMKTPVMIETFKQASKGRFDLEDSIPIKNSFYSIVDSSTYSLSAESDSESLLYTRIGQSGTIGELIYDMIIMSSNLATNLIIDLVDAKNVTQTMRSLGATNIQVLRGVEDIKAYEAGLSNTTSARDLLVIFEHLASDTLVNPEANRQMIQILLDQKFNEIIPAHLPDDVKVAHKTGAITGVHHDSGLVYLPDGTRYVLILLSKELDDFDEGTKSLADISKIIYNHTLQNP